MIQNRSDESKGSSRIRRLSQLNLFGMSKEALVKKIQTMIHQLKVFYKMMEEDPQKLQAKESAQRQVIIQSLTENQAKIKNKLTTLEKKLQQHEIQAIRSREQLQKSKKENQSLRKRMAILEKNRLKEQEDLTKEFKDQKTLLQIENSKLRKETKVLNSKIKILEELNRQTQDKFAEKMVKNIMAQKPLVQESQKQNCKCSSNVPNQKKNKVQIMALKQEAKQLRQRLRVSQEQRQFIKCKIQERQVFYSKMILSKQ